MKTRLIRIGKSRGIRIPKLLIEQCGSGETVGLRVEQDRIVISSTSWQPRQGWEEAFQKAGASTEEQLSLDTITNDFDQQEWEW